MVSQKDKTKLTAKQAAFVERYMNPDSETFGNAYRSAINAGYAKKSAIVACSKILDNSRVKLAISKYEAKNKAEIEWNQQTNRLRLQEQIDLCDAILADQPQNVQAINARQAAIREFNASNGLHTSTINTGTEKPKEYTPEEIERAQAMAKEITKPTLKVG